MKGLSRRRTFTGGADESRGVNGEEEEKPPPVKTKPLCQLNGHSETSGP